MVSRILFLPLAFTPTMENPMSLYEQINKDYITAYKAKDTLKVSVLRMLKASVKNQLVALCRPGGTLNEEEMLDIILKEGKQRRDSIAEYNKAGRSDLAEKEASELTLLEAYLPKPLSQEELAQIVEKTVTSLSATSPKDMGKVMNAIMKDYKGRVDGKVLSSAVKERLSH